MSASPKPIRPKDHIYYEREYYTERLQDATQARLAELTAAWEAGGRVGNKPCNLSALGPVAKAHWDAEPEDARASEDVH